MTTNELTKLGNLLPDAFYDIFAYLIPSGFLLIGIVTSLPVDTISIPSDSIFNSIVWSLLLAFLCIGGLYTIGLILTNFSYYVILLPILTMLGIKIKSKFDRSYLKAKASNAMICIELTKRYVRIILLRNIAFSSILLVIFYLIQGEWKYLFVVSFIFLVTFVSTWIRSKWLNDNIEFINNLDLADNN